MVHSNSGPVHRRLRGTAVASCKSLGPTARARKTSAWVGTAVFRAGFADGPILKRLL